MIGVIFIFTHIKRREKRLQRLVSKSSLIMYWHPPFYLQHVAEQKLGFFQLHEHSDKALLRSEAVLNV